MVQYQCVWTTYLGEGTGGLHRSCSSSLQPAPLPLCRSVQALLPYAYNCAVCATEGGAMVTCPAVQLDPFMTGHRRPGCTAGAYQFVLSGLPSTLALRSIWSKLALPVHGRSRSVLLNVTANVQCLEAPLPADDQTASAPAPNVGQANTHVRVVRARPWAQPSILNRCLFCSYILYAEEFRMT